MARHRNYRGTRWAEDELSDDDYYAVTPSPSPSVGSEYLYRRGDEQEYSLGDFVAHEDEAPVDDAELVEHVRSTVRPLLARSVGEDELVRVIRECNYEANEVLERLVADTQDDMFRLDLGDTAPRPPPGFELSPAPTAVPSQLAQTLPSRSEVRTAPSALSAVAFSLHPQVASTSAFDTPSPDDLVARNQEQAFQKSKEKVVVTSRPPVGAREPRSAPFLAKSGLEEQEKRARLKKADDDEAPQRKKREDLRVPQSSEAKRRKVLEQLSSGAGKPHLNLVVIGHVDAGKSTLMGHLLHLCGKVSDRVLHRYERDAKQMGKSTFHFAWVLDAHGDERERGVTTDVAVTSFETARQRVTLLDAPGHRDFVPNMITGAAQADAAVLVLNAIEGEFEVGFTDDGQTKEHVLLAKALGVASLIVAVNKMDQVGWSEARYGTICEAVAPYLRKSGFVKDRVTFLPLSGYTGDNIVEVIADELAAWYAGPSLLALIDALEPPPRPLQQPTRLVVSDVYRDSQGGLGAAVSGKLETGYLAKGDRLLVQPLHELCTVKALRVHDEPVEYVGAGQNVEVGIAGLDLAQIAIGSVLSDPLAPVALVSRFKAQLITFAALSFPLLKGTQVTFHFHHIQLPATLSKLLATLDPRSGAVKQRLPKALVGQCSAVVVLQLDKPICLELFSACKPLGRFTLRDQGKTLAAGIVTKLIQTVA